MKSKTPTILIALLVAGFLNSSLAADAPKIEAAQAFEQFMTLVGQWEGKREDGSTATASYRLSGNDSVIIEEFEVVEQDGYDMTTMYHLDGDRLMLTHYCMAKNQPRMEADLSSSSFERINFSFLDATNLKSAADGHMHSAVFRFLDEKSMEQAWTFRKDGVDSFSEVIRFERVN